MTLHPEEMAWRRARRERYGYPGGFETWTRPVPRGLEHLTAPVDHLIDGWGGGSSGFLAVGVARELGLRAVLCGVPMDARPHVGRTGAPWNGHASYLGPWTERQAALAPHVRSLSGWTRELFGAPDPAWLDFPARRAQTLG